MEAAFQFEAVVFDSVDLNIYVAADQEVESLHEDYRVCVGDFDKSPTHAAQVDQERKAKLLDEEENKLEDLDWQELED